MQINDGSKSIFLSTQGENDAEISKEMVSFLKFVRADLDESARDFGDDYVRSLQDSITSIKGSREMEERFMILQEMLRDEHEEGKAEAVLILLQELASVPEELQKSILEERNPAVLNCWLKLASKADSIDQFRKEM